MKYAPRSRESRVRMRLYKVGNVQVYAKNKATAVLAVGDRKVPRETIKARRAA